MFYNRKSKACSTGRTGMAFINPVKTFKNSLLFIFRNTNSIIFYAIKRMSINRSRKNIYCTILIRITNRIISNIIQHLINHMPYSLYRYRISLK